MVDLPDLDGTRYDPGGGDRAGRAGRVVYAARDLQLDRRVALKVTDAAWVGEARLIAHLEHPGIVPVHETGTLPDGRVFYAMKLVAGVRADRYVAGNPPLGERLRVVHRVGEALAYAHSCGVLHRDLKPQNVMVGRFGEVYVMDWGVEGVAGTPAFRAGDSVRPALRRLRSGGLAALPAARGRASRADCNRVQGDAAPSRRTVRRGGRRAGRDRKISGRAGGGESYVESPWQWVRRFAKRNEVLLWLLAAYAAAKFLVFFARGL